MGNNPDSTGGYMPLPPEIDGMNEVEREEYLAQIAKDFIREDPMRFLQSAAKRIFVLHNRETIGVAWNESAIEGWVGKIGLLGFKLLPRGIGIYWLWRALRCGSAFYTKKAGSLIPSSVWRLGLFYGCARGHCR